MIPVRKNILLVDEDASVREALVRALTLENYRVVSAVNASEAFQKGNALELQSRPSSPMINATFEKVQGAARKALDQERERPQVENDKP